MSDGQQSDPRSRLMRTEWTARVACPNIDPQTSVLTDAEAFEKRINDKLADLAGNNFDLAGTHSVGPMFVIMARRLQPASSVVVPTPQQVQAAAGAMSVIVYHYMENNELKSRDFSSKEEASTQIAADTKKGIQPISLHISTVTSYGADDLKQLVEQQAKG